MTGEGRDVLEAVGAFECLERWENATVRGRAWYKLLVAPVVTVDVTVQVKGVTFSRMAVGAFECLERWLSSDLVDQVA